MVVYMMRTHVRHRNVEVLLGSTGVGATKVFRMRGRLKRITEREVNIRIEGTLK